MIEDSPTNSEVKIEQFEFVSTNSPSLQISPSINSLSSSSTELTDTLCPSKRRNIKFENERKSSESESYSEVTVRNIKRLRNLTRRARLRKSVIKEEECILID